MKNNCLTGISLLFFLLICNCGPKAEKALTYKGSSSDGQLFPDQPWRHNPELTLDGKANTAFCVVSAQPNPGFSIDLEKNSEFSSIQIVNGFAKSANDALQNSQIKQLKVRALKVQFSDGKTKIDSEETVIIDLKPVTFKGDKANEQFVDLGKTFKGNQIRLEFTDVYKGSKHQDICLSEFRIGAIVNGKFSKYPISNESRIKEIIDGYKEGSKHYTAFQKLIKACELGTINFNDVDIVLPVNFKPDNTFRFSAIMGDDPNPVASSQAKSGSYTSSFLSSASVGLDITLNYFDAEGLEKNDTWIFRRAVPGDEDYKNFKTKMGIKFSEVFDPKTKYLMILKEEATGRSYYNYEISY